MPLINYLLVFAVVKACTSMEVSSIYIKKSKLDDQETSGSGYAYQLQSDGPDDVGFQSLPHFGYPPITVGKFVVNDEPKLLPLINYYQNGIDSYGNPVALADYLSAQPGNYGSEIDKLEYNEKTGQAHDAAHNSQQGEAGSSGYKKVDGYENGSKGKHRNDENKSYYDREGGEKGGQYGAEASYANKHSASKGERGESSGEAKGHKKGSKTTGYHNMYHKDEYKKDHSFYDKSDSRGAFNRYGSRRGQNAAGEGAFRKGAGYHDGYKGGNYASKGFADNGKFEDETSGYERSNGKQSFHKGFAEYLKRRENENKNRFGYDAAERYGDKNH